VEIPSNDGDEGVDSGCCHERGKPHCTCKHCHMGGNVEVSSVDPIGVVEIRFRGASSTVGCSWVWSLP